MTAPEPPSFAAAQAIVSTLAQGGVRYCCVCPGARSTSLALCSWLDARIRVTVHHDERAAGFFALGLALRIRNPVAVITTSGTAAAELYPAAVEAFQSQVPLVLLTADRPAYLRGTGSNQTIRQAGLFGPYVQYSVDVPPLVAASPEREQPGLRRKVLDALRACQGRVPGPVHLNLQCEKPFAPPEASAPAVNAPETAALPVPAPPRLTPRRLAQVQEAFAHARRGLIIAGPNRYGPALTAALTELARAWGMPLLADPLSGCRFQGAGAEDCLVTHYEALLQTQALDDLRPDLIFRLGALPVSTALIAYWQERLRVRGAHVYVNPAGRIHDETGAVTLYAAADPVWLCRELIPRAPRPAADRAWLEAWASRERRARAAAARFMAQGDAWDGGYAAAVVAGMPEGSALFAGNSLPIRLLDLTGNPAARAFTVYGNRGASGIDGVLSAALGVAYRRASPVVLLIGDLSLLHDLGGLAAVRLQEISNIVIVVLNNNGGGIFERLPAAALGAAFEPLFIAPHGLTFARFARGFGLQYARADSPAALRRRLASALAARRAALVEVVTDRRQDRQRARQFAAALAARQCKENTL